MLALLLLLPRRRVRVNLPACPHLVALPLANLLQRAQLAGGAAAEAEHPLRVAGQRVCGDRRLATGAADCRRLAGEADSPQAGRVRPALRPDLWSVGGAVSLEYRSM